MKRPKGLRPGARGRPPAAVCGHPRSRAACLCRAAFAPFIRSSSAIAASRAFSAVARSAARRASASVIRRAIGSTSPSPTKLTVPLGSRPTKTRRGSLLMACPLSTAPASRADAADLVISVRLDGDQDPPLERRCGRSADQAKFRIFLGVLGRRRIKPSHNGWDCALLGL
jgi:hypothetical protein